MCADKAHGLDDGGLGTNEKVFLRVFSLEISGLGLRSEVHYSGHGRFYLLFISKINPSVNI